MPEVFPISLDVIGNRFFSVFFVYLCVAVYGEQN